MSPPESSSRPSLDEADIRTLRDRLLGFYDDAGRDLPWRRTRDPYAIWISEVMSQQTRIETVVPYWLAWMESFPDVGALAAADEGAVLKSWEGLGYYSRARNLHRAAKVVRETLSGRIPDSRDGLRALPGIGSYTAGAVASIAYGEPVPAVDGNVRRVASRVLDWPRPGPTPLEAEVARWVPEDRPGDFNQALMELGATVCTPRAPGCDGCVLASLCRARAAGTVPERPAPRRRGPVRVAEERVTVAWRLSDGGIQLALRRRPSEGLLAGMWEFPGSPFPGDGNPGSRERGAAPEEKGAEELPAVPHTFSHLRMTYRPVLSCRGPDADPPPGARWFGTSELAGLPLPVAQRAILDHARASLAERGFELPAVPEAPG